MATANLLRDRTNERDYQLDNGRLITLKFDDFSNAVTFYDSVTGDELDGEFEFHDEHENGTEFLLKRMYAPTGLKNKGLGKAAIELFIANMGASVYTRPDDGQPREDGSHLTEDAPFFVSKMKENGLIEMNHDDLHRNDSEAETEEFAGEEESNSPKNESDLFDDDTFIK